MGCTDFFTLGNTLKILNLAAAVGLGFASVYRLTTINLTVSTNAVLSVYFFLFGLLILCSEFKLFRHVNKYFGFMTTIFGKGVFLIFCGALLIGKPVNPSTAFHRERVSVVVVIGIAILVLGFFNVGCSVCLKSDTTVKETGQAAQNAESINVPGAAKESKNLKKNKSAKADKKSAIRGDRAQKIDLEAAPGRQMVMI